MNPLSLQQSFQATNIEALRMAQGFNDGQARETMQKKVLDERTTLEQNNVPQIPPADNLKAEERKGRDQQEGKGGSENGAGQGEEGTSEGGGPAKPADSHLDFLV
jgi:hypothetical protein